MFRTPTGQTGQTAYLYEAAQIANAQRVLDARAKRLGDVIIDELPTDVSFKVSIATAEYPDATITGDRDSLMRVIPMISTARDARTLAHYIRAINSDYVVPTDR